MIQVDPDRSERTYVSCVPASGPSRGKSIHETVRGMTPDEVMAVIRQALRDEMLRRLSKLAAAG